VTALTEHLCRAERALMSIKVQEPLAVATAALVLKGTSNGSQGITRGGRQARRGQQRRLKARGQQLALELQTRTLLARHGALVVRMVRVAPRSLDDDNLATAFKRMRDAIAKSTGVHDASPLVLYVPDAERGDEHLVRVEVYEQLGQLEAAAAARVATVPARPGFASLSENVRRFRP
jgi:hypothetical protein